MSATEIGGSLPPTDATDAAKGHTPPADEVRKLGEKLAIAFLDESTANETVIAALRALLGGEAPQAARVKDVRPGFVWLRDKVTATEAELKVERAEKVELAKTLAEAQAAKVAFEERSAHAEAEVAALKADLETAQERIKVLEKENDTLEQTAHAFYDEVMNQTSDFMQRNFPEEKVNGVSQAAVVGVAFKLADRKIEAAETKDEGVNQKKKNDGQKKEDEKESADKGKVDTGVKAAKEEAADEKKKGSTKPAGRVSPPCYAYATHGNVSLRLSGRTTRKVEPLCEIGKLRLLDDRSGARAMTGTALDGELQGKRVDFAFVGWENGFHRYLVTVGDRILKARSKVNVFRVSMPERYEADPPQRRRGQETYGNYGPPPQSQWHYGPPPSMRPSVERQGDERPSTTRTGPSQTPDQISREEVFQFISDALDRRLGPAPASRY